MASILDPTKERDAHIEQRLRSDSIIWLMTVRPDGRPHAVAVWFLWDGDAFLIFSRPNNQKIRNLQANTHVLVAVDNTHEGDDPITIEGTATLIAQSEANLTAYVEKYSEGIKGLGFTPERMMREFSQAIRIRPTRVM